jgi:dihydropteroate synthase
MQPVTVMGIVNVTPDSFTGDGTLRTSEGHDQAIARGLAMARAGAGIIDVGGESTRPGHTPISVEEELSRVLPVVKALARQELTISIDTYKEEVAAAALDAGARIVNDIWGLQRSPGLARLAAERGSGLVLMHNQDGTEYPRDLLATIKSFLLEAATRARRAGVPASSIMLDPGIGFGKTAAQNLVVLQRLAELNELGYQILVGPSRKSFLGRIFGQEMSTRIWGTAAVATACILRGATVIRVHDVAEMKAVAQVAAGLR